MSTNARRAERGPHLIEEGRSEIRVRDEDILPLYEQSDDEVADEFFFADDSDDDGEDDLKAVMAEDIARGRDSMPAGCRQIRNERHLVEDYQL